MGLPRSINVICDRALECAYGANKKVIDAQCVLTAARQLKLEVPVGVWLRLEPLAGSRGVSRTRRHGRLVRVARRAVSRTRSSRPDRRGV